MVGVAEFESATYWLQISHATCLRYTPLILLMSNSTTSYFYIITSFANESTGFLKNLYLTIICKFYNIIKVNHLVFLYQIILNYVIQLQSDA